MTATQLQFRRGTAAQLATFAGAAGEVVVDTTNNRLVVCDGSTVGGFPAAKLSEVPALLSYQGSGLVNRFRNGTFDVWQRGASGSVTTSGGYTADGWIVVPAGASLSWQQGLPGGTGGVLPPPGSNYFLYLSGAAGITDVIVKQRIEGSVAAVLAGKQVTVQLAIYGGLASPPTPTLTVKHANALDNWSGATTDVNGIALQGLIPNAWKIQCYTFTAPSAAGNGLEISWELGALTSSSVAIGQADIRATPGVATGLNAAPPVPELRPTGTELLFCQRYYQKSYNYSTAPGSAVTAATQGVFSPGSNASGQTFSSAWAPFKVTMRAAPTVTTYDNAGNSGKVSWTNGSTWTDNGSIPGMSVGDGFVNVAAGPFSGLFGINYHYVATAEL